MNLQRNKVYVEGLPFHRGVGIHISRPHGDGRVSVAKPVEFESRDETTLYHCIPMVEISGDAAQELMDGLWQCGLRPTEGSGSAGSLAATERHLADMRALAMGALKKSGAIE